MNEKSGLTWFVLMAAPQVPQEILDRIEAVKDDEDKMKALGIQIGFEMCQKLLAAGAPGLHMYTLNLEKSAVGILQRLGLIKSDNPDTNSHPIDL